MKTLRCLSLLALLCSPQLFAQWTQQSSPTSGYLYDVNFATPLLGIVAGQSGELLRTTDGGVTWQKQSTWPVTLYKTKFVNSEVGWAVGGTAGKHGAILKTIDGGFTWSVQDSSFENIYLQSVSFVDAQYGWVIGSASYPDTAGRMYRTTDAGSTWIPVPEPNVASPNDVQFVDRSVGWAVGLYGGIVKTTDGGLTWAEVMRAFVTRDTGPQKEPLRKVWFVDRHHGWAVGGITGVETKMRTTDGGASWITDNIPMGGSSLQGLWFNDVNNGWTVGGGVGGPVVERTTDGGITWTKQSIPFAKGNLYGVCMTGPEEGWVVGDSGRILKTTNGGATLTGVALERVPRTFDLAQNYPNPFNPSTKIGFILPKKEQVSLIIYNLFGQRAVTLIDGALQAGSHAVTWDGRDASGTQMSSGIYFYTLRSGNFVATRKMILIK